jgi:hypothetical protein
MTAFSLARLSLLSKKTKGPSLCREATSTALKVTVGVPVLTG